MLPVLTSEQVKQAEQAWAKANQGDTWPLMVKAAHSFVAKFMSKLQGQTVLVVAGQGNNGGDGYYIGALLRQAKVKVTLVAPLGLPKSGIDAERAYQFFVASGGQVLGSFDELPQSAHFPITIDALFGSGLNRVLSEPAQQVILWLNQLDTEIVAVDVPSGLNADTGLAMPVAVNAKATHSFIALKAGTLTAMGPAHCGLLSLDTLTVSTGSTWRYQVDVCLPRRTGNTYKSEHGGVNVVGGQPHMMGAALIAAHAALNSGAGKVWLACDQMFYASALSLAPEIMLKPIGETAKQPLTDKVKWVIGPGLGQDGQGLDILAKLLEATNADSSQQLANYGVLDADGLRWLATSGQVATGWVLTPHEGEAAALLAWPIAKVQQDRIAAVQALSEQYKTCVVLKGAGSLVCDVRQTGQHLVFCHSGSPAMATPGMGDCLAGIIAALMAQGLDGFNSAITGVNWHARIGHELAKRQRIVLASDVIAQLPFGADSLY
ncbi:NAD(P)H-hydrate dehydratase [Motilimonas eburnea]|uniref:NAD(P)H-hydrate dehydratase n=1 Tax=Motilimonas eburnea TaxID=1737488 RepID=UPI001E455EBD|nr:NAD(P)H-hydrate dehydratase [Motilimonas eburnea]MCE2570248.1 NAD(P)H-hydrate dehydratase [Motilimonas eburnea]